MMHGFMGFGWIIWLVLIAGIVWIFTQLPFKSVQVNESALDILRKRYARGEITKEEFEYMKKELS